MKQSATHRFMTRVSDSDYHQLSKVARDQGYAGAVCLWIEALVHWLAHHDGFELPPLDHPWLKGRQGEALKARIPRRLRKAS